MKKTQLIFLSILTIFLFNFTKEIIVKNDLDKMNLKGKVKSIKEVSYKALVKSEKIVKGKKERFQSYDEMDKLFMFNEQGNEIERKEFYSEGSLNERYTKLYNKEGNLLETVVYNADGSFFYRATYIYDENNRCIECKGAESKWIYKYNELGNLIEEYKYYILGDEMENKKTYEYDKNNNKISESSYSEDSLDYKWTYKYDENKKLIEFNEGTDGVFNYKWIYKYDKKGNLIEEDKYSFGLLQTKSIYKYDFDKRGNWIKRIRFIGKLPKYILEREIIYF